jgi:hypothetical protein
MRWNRKGWLLLWIVAFGVPLGYFLLSYGNSLISRGDPPAPFPIPTTASAPTRDEAVFAWMQREGRPSVMPIWPDGFNARTGPRGDFVLFSETNQPEAAVAVSELMELHGEYVKTPPADAVIPRECHVTMS